MSLIENVVEHIASKSSVSGIQGINLNDNTFQQLLENQLNKTEEINNNNIFDNLGMPPGLQIEPLDGTDTTQNPENFVTNSIEETTNDKFEMKDIDIGNYFADFLRNSLNKNNPIYTLAQRNATNAYGSLAKDYIESAESFAKDIAKFALT